MRKREKERQRAKRKEGKERKRKRKKSLWLEHIKLIDKKFCFDFCRY
jgi:hypothetical protein